MLGIIDSDIDADSKEAKLKQFSAWSGYVRNQFRDFRVAQVSSRFKAEPVSPIDLITEPEWFPTTQAITLRPDNLVIPALAGRRTLRPVLGISTNLIYDVTYIPHYGLTSIPSFSLEYYPLRSHHFTFGADVEWPMWQHWEDHRFLQIQNIGLWSRYYFKRQGDRFHGFYMAKVWEHPWDLATNGCSARAVSSWIWVSPEAFSGRDTTPTSTVSTPRSAITTITTGILICSWNATTASSGEDRCVRISLSA